MPHTLARQVDHGKPDEHHENREDTNRHADAGATQALAAGRAVGPTSMIAIVPAAETTTMRSFARTSASQLWLVLYFDVVTDDRHKQLIWRLAAVQTDGSSCMRKSGSVPSSSIPGFSIPSFLYS